MPRRTVTLKVESARGHGVYFWHTDLEAVFFYEPWRMARLEGVARCYLGRWVSTTTPKPWLLQDVQGGVLRAFWPRLEMPTECLDHLERMWTRADGSATEHVMQIGVPVMRVASNA